jgi:hypothetical protein
LRAGINNVVEGTPTLKWLYESLVKANNAEAKAEPENIHMMAIRETVFQNSFQANENIEVEDNILNDFIPNNQAIGLPGDSGGAVIAFDKNNQPIVIGVASTVSTVSYGSTVTEMTITDSVTGLSKVITLSKVINGDFEANMKEFFDVLIKEGCIAPKVEGSNQPYSAIKPFSYTYKLNRFAVNAYAATSFSVNSTFISETMALFAK